MIVKCPRCNGEFDDNDSWECLTCTAGAQDISDLTAEEIFGGRL